MPTKVEEVSSDSFVYIRVAAVDSKGVPIVTSSAARRSLGRPIEAHQHGPVAYRLHCTNFPQVNEFSNADTTSIYATPPWLRNPQREGLIFNASRGNFLGTFLNAVGDLMMVLIGGWPATAHIFPHGRDQLINLNYDSLAGKFSRIRNRTPCGASGPHQPARPARQSVDILPRMCDRDRF